MGRDVPMKEVVCDHCGVKKWCYDFYGDYYCQACCDILDEEEDEDEAVQQE